MLVSPEYKTGYELFSKGLELPTVPSEDMLAGWALAFRVSEGITERPTMVIGFPDLSDDEITAIFSGLPPAASLSDDEAEWLAAQDEREMVAQTVSWRPGGD